MTIMCFLSVFFLHNLFIIHVNICHVVGIILQRIRCSFSAMHAFKKLLFTLCRIIFCLEMERSYVRWTHHSLDIWHYMIHLVHEASYNFQIFTGLIDVRAQHCAFNFFFQRLNFKIMLYSTHLSYHSNNSINKIKIPEGGD